MHHSFGPAAQRAQEGPPTQIGGPPDRALRSPKTLRYIQYIPPTRFCLVYCPHHRSCGDALRIKSYWMPRRSISGRGARGPEDLGHLVGRPSWAGCASRRKRKARPPPGGVLASSPGALRMAVPTRCDAPASIPARPGPIPDIWFGLPPPAPLLPWVRPSETTAGSPPTEPESCGPER
jgi:hypothetical protein